MLSRARGLVILGLVSGLPAFADWPMFGHDPAQTNCQAEGAGCMDSIPYVRWVWDKPDGYKAECPPVTADLDGDGTNEIFVTFRQDATIYAFEGADGSYLWTREMPGGPIGWNSPALGDIDGDSLPEIVLEIWANPGLYALNGEDGSTLWTSPSGEEILLIDSDNDGNMEVLIRNNAGAFDGATTSLLNGLTGSVIWSRQDTFVNSLLNPEITFVAGDLDGDSVLEVVNLTTSPPFDGTPSLHIYDARNGTLLLNDTRGLDPYPASGSEVWASPMLYDIDGDGNLEILVENWDMGGNGNAVVTAYRWDRVGDSLKGVWRYDDSVISDYATPVHFSATDLNDDDKIEIVTGIAPGEWFSKVLNGETGQPLFPYYFFPWPYTANLDSDAYPDILLTNCDGPPMWIRLYQIYPVESLLWEMYFIDSVRFAIISDVDGDNRNEIVLAGYRVMVLDGNDTMDVAEGAKAPAGLTPRVIYENGEALLLFPSGAPENTSVKIYDVRGALVREEKFFPDERRIPIQVQARGIYFVLIKTPQGVFRTKVIVK